MKFTTLLPLIILYIFVGCSKSEDSPNVSKEDLHPSIFVIEIDDVNHKSATIKWTASIDPKDKTIYYSVYLDGHRVEDNTTDLSYSWENLSEETSYIVKIEASNGVQTTTTTFSFTTKKYVPLVFDGDMILRSQQEVIDFGNEGYAEISGLLEIRDSGNPSDFYITDLGPLNELTKVGGDLIVELNYQLENLEGLNNLHSIGGKFKLKNNFDLVSLQGLEGLISVGENLEIEGNFELIDIDGLIILNSIGADLIIASEAITTLEGLSNLTNVGMDIAIIGVKEMTNMEGLGGITSIEGNLRIKDCIKLESLVGLDNLVEVKSGIDIMYNDALINMEGLGELSTVGRVFEINANTSLENLNGLEGLTIVHSFQIWNNNQLENIDALANISFIGGYCNIEHNESLVNLCGIRPFLLTNSAYDNLSVNNNGYNPFQHQIIDGDCSL